MSLSSLHHHSQGAANANDGIWNSYVYYNLAHTQQEIHAWIQAELPQLSWIVRIVMWMRVNIKSRSS